MDLETREYYMFNVRQLQAILNELSNNLSEEDASAETVYQVFKGIKLIAECSCDDLIMHGDVSEIELAKMDACGIYKGKIQ